VGLTAELGANFDGGRSDSSLVTAMGGLVLKARNNKRLQPFVRGVAGLSRVRAADQQFRNVANLSDTSFAFAVGTGLDLKFKDHGRVGWRILQVDYLQTRALNDVQHSVRLGTGLVF
jgi:hypothetical protein